MSRTETLDGFSPAPLVRGFGWVMIAALAAFLINNYLSGALNWPGLGPFVGDGDKTGRAWIQLGIYAALIVLALAYVMRSTGTSLRSDASRITRFNTYLVRAAFWAVLLIGLADAAISFLRVEGFLTEFFTSETAGKMARARWRGPYIHMPLILAGAIIALFFRSLGFTWLALLIVVAELAIVITRFVFSYEQAFMGDLVRFWYAALFLFASAYTLLEDGHVRVDVFYAAFKSRMKGFVNAWGAILMGILVCWVILVVGMGNRTSIISGPMINYEVSQSGFGMYTKYLMAAFLAVFAITMLIQFVAQLFESVADYRDEPGAREPAVAPAH